jgi:uncharacterized protein YkwD
MALNIVDIAILFLLVLYVAKNRRILAFVDGVISLSIILFLLVIFPILPGIKKPIEESFLGSVMVAQVAHVEGRLSQMFTRASGFLTIEPKEDEKLSLPFKPAKLEIDEDAEAKMLELVNAERKKAGLEPVVIDESIVAVAREHSKDMWERQYFAHENPDGETPFDRMEDGEVFFHKAGENLALARTVERAHKGLMNSPGHKRNILDPTFSRIGIGVIDGGIYGKMFTQDFAD